MPLSAKQMEYLALAWQCFETEPKVDYVHFATVAGLASAHSARELLRVTKKKLKEEYGAMSGGMRASNANNTTAGSPTRSTTVKPSPSPNKTPRSTAGAKRGRPAGSAGTPTGKGRKNGAAAGKNVTAGDDGENGDSDDIFGDGAGASEESGSPAKKSKTAKTAGVPPRPAASPSEEDGEEEDHMVVKKEPKTGDGDDEMFDGSAMFQ